MHVLVIGATGTIGAAVAGALAGRHRVTGASRRSGLRIDIEEPASIRAALAGLDDLDAVICCAGAARFKPLAALSDEDFAFSLTSKLMGQVNVVRAALERLRDGGSVTAPGKPAAEVARAYLAAVEGSQRGAVIPA